MDEEPFGCSRYEHIAAQAGNLTPDDPLSRLATLDQQVEDLARWYREHEYLHAECDPKTCGFHKGERELARAVVRVQEAHEILGVPL